LPKEATENKALFPTAKEGPTLSTTEAAGGKQTSSLSPSWDALIQKALEGAQRRLNFLSTALPARAEKQGLETLLQAQGKQAAETPAPEQKPALTIGRDATLKIHHLSPPDGPELPPPMPDQIKAVVVGKSAGGYLLLQSASEVFLIHEKADLPVGNAPCRNAGSC
jgi:hypothetical protein